MLAEALQHSPTPEAAMCHPRQCQLLVVIMFLHQIPNCLSAILYTSDKVNASFLRLSNNMFYKEKSLAPPKIRL